MTKAVQKLKVIILQELSAIDKLAQTTCIEGSLSINYSFGGSIEEWDELLKSITEYPKVNHIIQVSNNLIVKLILN